MAIYTYESLEAFWDDHYDGGKSSFELILQPGDQLQNLTGFETVIEESEITVSCYSYVRASQFASADVAVDTPRGVLAYSYS